MTDEKPELDTFTTAYIEAAFWTSTDESNDFGGDQLDENWETDQLTPEALAEIVSECKDFREIPEVAKALEAAYATDDYFESQAGHDFWLTRNGHGAGYWDRGLGELGETLTKWAKTFGSQTLYVTGDPFDGTGAVHVGG